MMDPAGQPAPPDERETAVPNPLSIVLDAAERHAGWQDDEAEAEVLAAVEVVAASQTQILITLADRSQVIVQCAAIVGEPTVMHRPSPGAMWGVSYETDPDPFKAESYHLGSY